MTENALPGENHSSGNTQDSVTQMTIRREALDRLKRALEDIGVRAWPAPGIQPVLSLWPGLHVGVSSDGTLYGWTIPGFPAEIATCPVNDVDSAARRIAGRFNLLSGVARWMT